MFVVSLILNTLIMRLILLGLLIVSRSISAYGQDETVYFSDAIKTHLQKYNNQSDAEYEKGDTAKGQALFDSLVQNYLVGSRFNDFSFKSVDNRKVRLSKIKKPVFIITYASWCVLGKGEVPALNKLARKYAKNIRFIVLFWDKKSEAKKIGRKFSGNITVCYANESYRNDGRIVATLKHTLGFPVSYFLNSNLDVVDIKRGGVQTDPKMPFREAMTLNYNLFDDRLTECLLKKDLVKEQLVNTD
ncbi:MAG: redoxin domain-containing protein [Flavobacterium sp.]|nr:MAG: redoxin domain-containing protein [Flavobacterium sp.]